MDYYINTYFILLFNFTIVGHDPTTDFDKLSHLSRLVIK
jgi:hypothetical protein